ncbi:MAG: hypothetical protein JWM68_2432 [Verrucomicrobiales bacterium]|nr:hypothetical protein [Verrucomicrobiales bacterium]
MFSKLLFVAAVLLAAQGTILQGAEADKSIPPNLDREFRGVWVATVANIDWPSSPGLSTENQKEELIAILDRSKKLNLNAVIFQARPACDALYASELEPWSEYLTGKQGEAPEPFYDPLKFAVEEAHKRGLELHVWLNPYRAKHTTAKSAISAQHLSKKHPEMVLEYGKYLWLDPGLKAVQDHSLAVVNDIVKRYDIDGLHFDDYFYPYPEKDTNGASMPFPDDKSWKIYQDGGGQMNRDDWRRQNVDQFIERVYKAVKVSKPWVKFGVSPFGIWQPHYPESIEAGINVYETLYCDSRKWLTNGWCDYFAPQLYWKIDQTKQSYPVLLQWWIEQNVKNRNLWIGNFTSKVGEGWEASELINQVKLTREQRGASGNIHFSMKPFMQDRGNIATELKDTLYTAPALVPASPWLNNQTVLKPTIKGKAADGEIKVNWTSKEENLSHWVIQTRVDGKWSSQIVGLGKLSQVFTTNEFSPTLPNIIAVTAVNRYGSTSSPALFEHHE